MKSTELRIGNLINYLGRPTKVNSIAGTDIFYVSTIKSGVMTGACFEPILLTEEWLLKLPNGLIYPIWIKYLHELQNWYYWNNEKKELELIFTASILVSD